MDGNGVRLSMLSGAILTLLQLNSSLSRQVPDFCSDPHKARIFASPDYCRAVS